MAYIHRILEKLSNIGVAPDMSPVDALNTRHINQITLIIAAGCLYFCYSNIVLKVPIAIVVILFLFLFFVLSIFPLHYYGKFRCAKILLMFGIPIFIIFFHVMYGEKLGIGYALTALVAFVFVTLRKTFHKYLLSGLLTFLFILGTYFSNTFGGTYSHHVKLIDTIVVISITMWCTALFLNAVIKELNRRIREQTKLNVQLAKANKELLESISNNSVKDKLFALVAHDLRSPLISLGGLSNKVNYLIQRNRPAEIVELGDTIEQAVTSVHKLLDNLLAWAMVQGGKFPNSPTEVKVGPIIEEVALLHSFSAETKGIEVNYSIGETEMTAFCDANALRTIIRNLLDNAIKYTPTGGRIDVAAHEEGGIIVIKLTNTGEGIDEETLKYLFTLTGKKGLEGTKKEKGIGLGLSLCKELVGMNHGHITAESTPGEYTAFKVTLLKQPLISIPQNAPSATA